MVQQVPSLVRPVRLSDSAAIQAELLVPNPRRLLIGSCVAIFLLGLLAIGAVWYAVRSIDQMSLEFETQRARAAIEAVLAEGALPDAETAAHLTKAFSPMRISAADPPERVRFQSPCRDRMHDCRGRRGGSARTCSINWRRCGC